MKKIITKILLCLLLLSVLLSIVSCGASAPDANGSCGADLKWEYKASDRTLTISGTGEMNAFASSADVPWASVRSSAKSILLKEGVTSVSDYAFYGFSAVTEPIELPATLLTIGKCAFAYCSAVEKIALPSGLYSVGEGAFEGCTKLTTVNLPATLATLGARAYAFCPALTDVQILGTVKIENETFFKCNALTTVQFHSSITEISDTAFRGTSFAKENIQYTESVTASATLTIIFRDVNGNTLQAPATYPNLAYNSAYSETVPSIEGYTPDRPVVSGRIMGVDITEAVTYTKNEEATTADPAVTTAPEEAPNKTSSIIAIVIFAVVLVGIAVAAFLLIRSDKKNQGKSATVRKSDSEKNKKKK